MKRNWRGGPIVAQRRFPKQEWTGEMSQKAMSAGKEKGGEKRGSQKKFA